MPPQILEGGGGRKIREGNEEWEGERGRRKAEEGEGRREGNKRWKGKRKRRGGDKEEDTLQHLC